MMYRGEHLCNDKRRGDSVVCNRFLRLLPSELSGRSTTDFVDPHRKKVDT